MKPPLLGPLGIYLNGHLGGATGGVELINRIAHRYSDTGGSEMRQIAADIAEDRVSLLAIMENLNIPARRYMIAGGWIVGKLSRFRLSENPLAGSGLSSIAELEAMLLGVEGKAALWRALRVLAPQDDRLDLAQLDDLLARAQHQAQVLEQARQSAIASLDSSD